MAADPWEKIAAVTSPIASAAQKVEDGMSMVFGNLLTLMLCGLAALMAQDQWGHATIAEKVIYVSVGLGWLLLDLPYLLKLWYVAFRGNRPWALDTASRQRMVPVLLRPIISLWWLAHFAFGASFAMYSASMARIDDPIGMHVLTFVLACSYGFAANGYLILSACSITRSQAFREAVWRHRGLIDLALGIVGALWVPKWFGMS